MKKQFVFYLLLLNLLFFSLSSYSQWAMYNGMYGSSISSFAVSGNNIFAGVYYSGVFISTNNGINWSQTSLSVPWVRSLLISGSYIFAGTDKNGIYRSTNNGVNWSQTSITNKTVFALGVLGSYIFAGIDSTGIYRSTNNGLNWTQTSLNNKTIYSFAVQGNNIFAGTGISGVYRSTNNGANWTQAGLNRSIYCLVSSGSYLFAGASSSNGGVFVSSNNGSSCVQTSLNNKWIRSFAVNQGTVFAGTDSGVFLTKNNGSNWFKKNQGFPFVPSIYSLLFTNNYIFAGTNGYSIWRRLYSEIISINFVSSKVPSSYSLEQNFPNPFNPTTNIKFQIPKNEFVSLKVYDILGKEVATLVNEKLYAGEYQAIFNARLHGQGSGLASGVYFYKLETDNFTDVKRMVIIK